MRSHDHCGFCPPTRRHCWYRKLGIAYRYHAIFNTKPRTRAAFRLANPIHRNRPTHRVLMRRIPLGPHCYRLERLDAVAA